MIAPLQPRSNISFWTFISPFSWQLWITIGALFIVTMSLIFFVEWCGRADEHDGGWGKAFSKSFW